MSPDVSKRFGVTEYPHLILFKNRKVAYCCSSRLSHPPSLHHLQP